MTDLSFVGELFLLILWNVGFSLLSGILGYSSSVLTRYALEISWILLVQRGTFPVNLPTVCILTMGGAPAHGAQVTWESIPSMKLLITSARGSLIQGCEMGFDIGHVSCFCIRVEPRCWSCDSLLVRFIQFACVLRWCGA